MKGYLVLAALLGGGTLLLVALLLDTLGGRRKHPFGVAEFLAAPVVDERVQVHGTIAHGSLWREDGDRCGYRFDLVDSALGDAATPKPHQVLPVAYQGCVVPDSFSGYERGLDVEATVVGTRCSSCRDFEALTLLAEVRF